MNTRERFQAVTRFQPFDRLPLIEWAMWWNQTIDRWHGEALPATCQDRYDLYDHFGLDQYKQDWFPVVTPECPQAPGHGQPIIRNEADYERIRPHLYPDPFANEDRVTRWKQWAAEQATGDSVLWFTVDGYFWFPRRLLGIEPHLFAFYDQPALMQRINQDLADWHLRVIEKVCEICTPDFMTFGEDMSYNLGPMLSEEQFAEFLEPHYQRVVPALRRRGIVPIIDSDGDITIAAPWFERAGLAGILPLERQAGVDLEALRVSHPNMIFIGHFDKMTMDRGEAAMRAEFERLLPLARQGGFLISVDHQTPPGVSYEGYQCYLHLFREYASRAAG